MSVFARDAGAFDAAIRSWTVAHQSPGASLVFRWASRIFSVTPMVLLAIVGAAVLAYRRRFAAAAIAASSGLIAVAAYLGIKGVVQRPRPTAAGNLVEGTYSFPSAHATTSAAVCATLAYVLWREGMIGGWPATALAIGLPLLVGASRVYLDVHWATDVIGGWTVGLVIAAALASVHRFSGFANAPDARVTR